MAGHCTSGHRRRSFSRIFGRAPRRIFPLEPDNPVLDRVRQPIGVPVAAVGSGRSAPAARSPCSDRRSCSRSSARSQTRRRGPPSSRRPAGGRQTEAARRPRDTPSTACPLLAERAECHLCLRNELLPLSQEGQLAFGELRLGQPFGLATTTRVSSREGCPAVARAASEGGPSRSLNLPRSPALKFLQPSARLAGRIRVIHARSCWNAPCTKPPGVDKSIVYILRSVGNPQRHYTGITSCLENRLAWHNAGQNIHTARDRPWKVIAAIALRTEEAARAFERYLKSGSGRAFAKRHFP